MNWLRTIAVAWACLMTACREPGDPLDVDFESVDTSTYRVPGISAGNVLPPRAPDSSTRALGGDTLLRVNLWFLPAPTTPMDISVHASSHDTAASASRPLSLGFASCPIVFELYRTADRADAPVWSSHAARPELACPANTNVSPTGASVGWRVPDILGDSLPEGRYFFSYTVRLADDRQFEFKAGDAYLTADTALPTRDLTALKMLARSEIAGVGPRMLRTAVTLTNTGVKPLRFDHGACNLNVRLYRTPDRTGPPVWRSEHRRDPGSTNPYACILPLYLKVLAPGDSTVFAIGIPMYEVVGDSLPAGTYFVSAELELLNDDKPLSEWSTTYTLPAGVVDIAPTPDRLPSMRAIGGLTYDASTRVIPGIAGNDTVRTTARITNNGSQRTTADVVRDCPVSVYAYRLAERRDSIPIVTPTIVAARSCYVISHRFMIDPGQSYSFSQDMLANDIRSSAGAGTYYFTAWIGVERSAIISAGEAIIR